MAGALPIPLVALADCGAILGRRGAGKSGTGRVLLEHELDAGHRCCVIDPKGDWYGIRLTKDGQPSRFQIPVFGGVKGDAEITDKMGVQVATIVATSSTSCIVDLSQLSVSGQRRFMTAFAEQLFMLNRQPMTLFVDEADQLAPQRVSADQAKLLHHMESLIRQGRQRGIFMWMLTQRPAVINKNLLSQAETLIAMKMTGPHDRAAIREWMDAHDPDQAKAVEAGLSKLSVGQAFAWVPGADFLERVQFPFFETYDSGCTPQHGEIVGDVELPALDVGQLAAMLKGEDDEPSDALADALAEIERLRVRNARLQEETARAGIERDAAITTLTAVQDAIGAAIGSPRIHPLPADADPTAFVMLTDTDGDVRPFPRAGDRSVKVAAGRRRMRAAVAPSGSLATDAATEMPFLSLLSDDMMRRLAGLTPARRRIVGAIVAAGGRTLTRDEIADAAGISPTSSNMGIGLRRLAEAGLVDADGEGFRFDQDKHRAV